MVPLNAEQQELVASHMRVAVMAGRKMGARARTWMTLEDGISSAYVGLCKAALAFDPKRRVKFATLAWRCCCQQIHDDTKDLGPLIHIPRYLWNKKREREKIYNSSQNAANAAQNRLCMEQALRIEHWSMASLDTLHKA